MAKPFWQLVKHRIPDVLVHQAPHHVRVRDQAGEIKKRKHPCWKLGKSDIRKCGDAPATPCVPLQILFVIEHAAERAVVSSAMLACRTLHLFGEASGNISGGVEDGR